MSSLTTCNYCVLKRMRKEAKEHGRKIMVKPSSFMGGNCIFSVPKGVKLEKYIEPNNKLKNGDEIYREYSVGWMQEIPDHCCC